MNCCLQFGAFWEGDSPFDRNIVLGYYDGPTGGVVRCGACGKGYKYDIVAWDATQEIRLYALCELAPGSFDAVEELLSATGTPRYPDWVILWSTPGDELRLEFETQVNTALSSAAQVAYLVLGTTPTSTIRVHRVNARIDELLKHRPLPNTRIDSLEDWKSYLDI